MRLLLVIGMFLGLTLADGRGAGRRGNEAYRAGSFDEATEAYRDGLMQQESEGRAIPPSVRFGLTNNLGAATYRQDQPGEALSLFDAAIRDAIEPGQVAKAAYNAGNAAFKSEELQKALAYYRKALLEDPTNQDAKFNYEFVKRRLQEQGEGGQQQQDQNQPQDSQGQGDQQGADDQQDQDQDQQQQQEPENEQGQDGANQPDDQEQQESDQQQGDADQPGEQQNEPDEQQSEGRSPGAPDEELSREQAERILEALERDEAQLLREVQKPKSQPRRVEKDW